MMRAAFVGVAFGIRAGIDALRDQGARISRLRMVGGGTVDPMWRMRLVELLGLPLDVVACPNASARGAALLAGMAIGHWSAADLDRLSPTVTPIGEPTGSVSEQEYRDFLALCRSLGAVPVRS